MSGERDERRHPTPPSAAPAPQQLPIGAVPVPPPGYLPPPPGSVPGGGPRWLVVAAIVLVVVIGTGVTAVLTSHDDDPEAAVDDGETTTSTAQRLVDADGPGDDVLAYEIESTVTYEDGDQPPSLTHGYALYVRRDGVMSVVHMMGGLEEAPSGGEVRESGAPDVDLVHQLAERADEKLRAVLDE